METIDMDDQEIPRNLKSDFCDNPNISPIEFSRNSSLIDSKARMLNMSLEKLAEKEYECMNFTSSDQFVRKSNDELDSKFIEQSYEENSLNFEMEEINYNLSFDDEDFRSFYPNSPFFKNKNVINLKLIMTS